MQIDHFYPDWVPSARNPLDSIVLSPHTIKPNEFSLMDKQVDASDYRAVLPPVSSCQYYYEQDACVQSQSFCRRIRNIWHQTVGKKP